MLLLTGFGVVQLSRVPAEKEVFESRLNKSAKLLWPTRDHIGTTLGM